MQSTPSWPATTTFTPLSNLKIVPGSGQAKSMVWAGRPARQPDGGEGNEARRSASTGQLSNVE